MNAKLLFIHLFLFLGAFQVISQDDDLPNDPFDCFSFTNIQQNCDGEGAIDLTFNISNNSNCVISNVIIAPSGTIGIPTLFNIQPFSESTSTFTITGTTPGSITCFNIELLDNEGKSCCSSSTCLTIVTLEECCTEGANCDDGDPCTINDIFNELCECEGEPSECCDFQANLISTTCGPEGNLYYQVSGGSGDYTTTIGTEEPSGSGYFEEVELDIGNYTATIWDNILGCETTLPFSIEDECCDFEATVHSTSCAPDGRVIVHVNGGTPGYISPDMNEIDPGVFESEENLDPGTYTYTIWDRNGCETEVTFIIEDECCAFEANLINTTCGPEGNVYYEVTGGSGDYTTTIGYENPLGSGLFEEVDLNEGTYTATIRDNTLGCETTLLFTIEDECCDFEAKVVNKGCGTNGFVLVNVKGGTPGYISYDMNEIDPGVFESEENLDPGTYTYTIWDNNGCETDVTFTIEDTECCDGCNRFTNVVAGLSPGGEFPELPFYAGTGPISLISQTDATIYTRFKAGFVPDRYVITVNGVTVRDKTLSFCPGVDCNPFNDLTTGLILLDTFCVAKCEEVVFTFFSDVCSQDCTTNMETAWIFEVIGCGINCNGSASVRNDEIVTRSRTLGGKPASQTLEITPSIVSDVLSFNILNNTDVPNLAIDRVSMSEIKQFSLLRIIDKAGAPFLVKNIFGQNHIELDISSIPKGIYFLEISDENGYQITKRFIKI